MGYKYIGKKPVRRRANGKWVALGVKKPVEVKPTAPKLPYEIPVATDDDLKELAKIWPDVIETKRGGDTTGSEKSDSGSSSGRKKTKREDSGG